MKKYTLAVMLALLSVNARSQPAAKTQTMRASKPAAEVVNDAAKPADPTSIHELVGCTMNAFQKGELKIKYLQSLRGDASAGRQYLDGLAAMYQCIDAKFKPAVEAAGEHTDLKAAVKSCYVKSREYVGALNTGAERSAERELSEAITNVNMEINLAGMQAPSLNAAEKTAPTQSALPGHSAYSPTPCQQSSQYEKEKCQNQRFRERTH